MVNMYYINSNMRNEKKSVEKIAGCTSKITHIASTNFLDNSSWYPIKAKT